MKWKDFLLTTLILITSKFVYSKYDGCLYTRGGQKHGYLGIDRTKRSVRVSTLTH